MCTPWNKTIGCVVKEEFSWPWAGDLPSVGTLLLIWVLAFVTSIALPPLLATATGQGEFAPVYARYALVLTLVAMSIIGLPIALIGFVLLVACAAIPPLGRAVFQES